VLLSLAMVFEKMIPAMAKVATVAGSTAVTDMWESQYCFALVVVLMPVITKC
jgi:hypothetical protein